MSLVAGTRLGPYEVLGLIGSGGMGEVYKARDTRLDRSVAIKILPAELSTDPDRRTRFEREARAVAALSHPHICTLHDIGTHDGTTYLVMEHLAGESLAERLGRGPVPLAQALDIAAQVAEALDAAHKHGIIHRDLKPGNVMLTAGGSGRSGAVSAKLLDFGLAKLAAHGERPALAGGVSVPTRAAPVTAEGTILGTLQYMAPEQLEGTEADARTDLWALGAILYEMLTGRRAFEGDSQVSLIGNIMNAEPAPLATLQPLTPPSLDRVVKKCLAKHPDDRWDTAHDVADELRWIVQTSGAASTVTVVSARRRWWRRLAPIASVGVIGVAAGAAITTGWFVRVRPAPAAPRSLVRFTIDVPATRAVSTIALSPDGRSLAYVGTETDQSQVYLRRMDQSADAPVAGTRGANPVALCFSPDGSRLAFASGPTLRTIAVSGGDPVTLMQAPTPAAGQQDPIAGVDWARDGTMLFTMGTTGVWRLPESGAAPMPLTTTDAARGEYAHTCPTLLPDGRHVLVTMPTGMPYDAAPLVAVDARTGKQQRLLADGVAAKYLNGGYLLYASGASLLTAPFDPLTLRLGDATPVIDDLARYGRGGTIHQPLYAVSRAGDLAYVPAEPPRPAALVHLDRLGKEDIITDLPAGSAGGALSLSPDGRRLTFYRNRSRRMWPSVVDLTRGIPEELPLDRNAHALVWLPDGQRLAFSSDRDGAANIFVRDAASGGGSEKLIASPQHGDPASWTRDGRMLAYAEVSPATSWDLWVYDVAARKAVPFLRTAALERNPAISPGGRWLAYCSNTSGREEVYAEAFPSGGRRIKISSDGGVEPLWSADGRELFYRSGTALMRVGIEEAQELNPGKPVPLFGVTSFATANTYGPVSYAVTADGKSFYFVKPSPLPPEPTRIHVVLGWIDEFTRSLKR